MAESLAFEVRLDGPFDEAIDRVTAALKEQGFGALTRIDIDQALKEKIGVAFRRYVILGACNPKLAHRALSARPEVGLLLPCNVTLDEATGGAVTVRITDPALMMTLGGFEDDPAVAAVAAEAHELLGRVAATLS